MSVNQKQLTNLLTQNTQESSRAVREFLFQHKNNPECAKSVVAVVNHLLTNGKTRSIGLQFLQVLITQYSSDVFTDNILHWSSYCMVHHNKDSTKVLKLKTLTLLIKHGNNAEFSKKFSAEYLNITLKACLIYRNNEERVVGLKCLTQCMKRYSSWFGNHKDKVEEYLIDCLKSSCGIVAEAAALAFTSLLETGAAGIGGINYTNNFRYCFKKLCATIHTLYNNFFGDFSAFGDSMKIDEDIFPLVPSIDELEDAITVKIINCLILLRTLLVQPFSVEKQIFPKHVIDVIHKGLSAYFCFSEDMMDNTNNRPVLLKQIQLHLFKIFRILMKGYHSSLMPFSVIFENTLLKIFQRVAKCNCFVHDMRYKTSVYKALICWFSANKIINEAQFQEKILPIILEDIGSSEKAVLLSVNLPDTQKPKFAQKINLNETVLQNDTFIEHRCIYALDALKHLLSASLTIDHLRLKEMILLISRKLCDIQSHKICAPYNYTTCQVKLYETFISFVKKENLNILPSLHLMTNILKIGINSRNSRISQTSMDGLDLLEKISHSACPTLNFTNSSSLVFQPVDMLEKTENIQDITHSSENNIKIISNILITSHEHKTVTTENKNEDLPIQRGEDREITKTSVCEELEDSRTTTKTDEAIFDDDFEDMFCSFENVVQDET